MRNRRKLGLPAALLAVVACLPGCDLDAPEEPFEPYVEEAKEKLSLQNTVTEVTEGGAALPTLANQFVAVIWSTLKDGTACVDLANRSERIMAEVLVPYPERATIGVKVICNHIVYEPDNRATSIHALAEKYGMQQGATPSPKET